MNDKERKIVAIVGPTASGKTGIGVRLAKEFNGEIVSADSRQVYRGLDIGSGKEGKPCEEFSIVRPRSPQVFNSQFSDRDKLPNQKQNKNFVISGERSELRNLLNDEVCSKKRSLPADGGAQDDREKTEFLRANLRCINSIPQWLIDIAKPGERFTLFDWLPLARLVIEDIFSRGKVPIIVGGTGLYIQALVEGFRLASVSNDQVLNINKVSSVNDHLDIDKLEIESLRQLLKRLDAITYETIDLNNPHRLKRAIERAREGLKPVKVKPDFEVLQIGIDLPRDELYKKIDDRVESRFSEGMLEEASVLIADGVDPGWLIKLGLEYRIITEFILKSRHSPASLIEKFPPHVISSDEALKPRNLLWGKRLQEDPSTSLRFARDDIKEISSKLKLTPQYPVMKQELKHKIHAFARRQLTWFRRFPEIRWLNSFELTREAVSNFLKC